CLHVGVERNATIRIRIPQRQFTSTQRVCNEARQGLVITIDIEGYSVGSREQYIAVKNDHFNEESQNASRTKVLVLADDHLSTVVNSHLYFLRPCRRAANYRTQALVGHDHMPDKNGPVFHGQAAGSKMCDPAK